MKLDKDRVREILLQVEASTDPKGWIATIVPGHSQEVTADHVQILNNAGFIQADDLATFDG